MATKIISTVLLLVIVFTGVHGQSCNSLSELEMALYNNSDNTVQLSYAFFPSADRTSRFIEIR